MTAHGTPLASTPLADDAVGLANTLTAFRYDNLPDTFFSASVQRGPVTVTQGARFNDPDNFFGVSVVGGIANIHPPIIPAANNFFAGVVAGGTVGITQAARFDDSDQFFTQSIVLGGRTLAPDLFTNSNTFFTSLLTGQGLIQPGLFLNSNIFYSPVTTGGAPLIIQNARFDDPDSFPFHAIGLGAVNLQPPFLSDLPDTFFGPVRVELISGDLPGSGKAKKKVLRYRDPNVDRINALMVAQTLYEEQMRKFAADRQRKMWAAAAALLMDY